MLWVQIIITNLLAVFLQIAVEAERSVKGLYQFLKQNVAIPFTLSKSGGGETASTIETKVDASTSDNTKDEL